MKILPLFYILFVNNIQYAHTHTHILAYMYDVIVKWWLIVRHPIQKIFINVLLHFRNYYLALATCVEVMAVERGVPNSEVDLYTPLCG